MSSMLPTISSEAVPIPARSGPRPKWPEDFHVYMFRGYPDNVELVATAHEVTPDMRRLYDKQGPTRLLICSTSEDDALRSYIKVMGFASKTRHKK